MMQRSVITQTQRTEENKMGYLQSLKQALAWVAAGMPDPETQYYSYGQGEYYDDYLALWGC
jgi:hypothetical protein